MKQLIIEKKKLDELKKTNSKLKQDFRDFEEYKDVVIKTKDMDKENKRLSNPKQLWYKQRFLEEMEKSGRANILAIKVVWRFLEKIVYAVCETERKKQNTRYTIAGVNV